MKSPAATTWSLEGCLVEELTDAEMARIEFNSLSDPTVGRLITRLRTVEAVLKATTDDVARRHALAMEQKSRADKLEKDYGDLKLYLEMYKDQWKREWEKRKAELEVETADTQARWFHDHLNDEVEAVEEERDEAIAVAAAQRAALESIVKTCSWTREEHDPLVGVGLTANAALAHDVGEGWISPKKHASALEQLRAKLERAAVGSLVNVDDQLRVSSSMRALHLEGQ